MAQIDPVGIPAFTGPPPKTARERETRRLIWVLSLGALGLAWSITTVAAYLPPILETFTSSTALIGTVLACEGIFAIVLPLVIGPMSDATRTPFGRRRPYMAFAIAPMTLALVMVAFMPSFAAHLDVAFELEPHQIRPRSPSECGSTRSSPGGLGNIGRGLGCAKPSPLITSRKTSAWRRAMSAWVSPSAGA